MPDNLEMDLLTIPEAAQILKVSTVTLHRWIKQRRLPAFHVGPRKVRIRLSDLAQVLAPVRGEAPAEAGRTVVIATALPTRPLTEQQIQEGLEAMREADELTEAMRSRRKGKPLSPSWPLIRKAPEERSKQLL